MKEFIQLREAWFNRVMKFDPASDDQRIEGCKSADVNRTMKATYDQQTIGIILGKDYKVAPTCAADLGWRGEE